MLGSCRIIPNNGGVFDELVHDGALPDAGDLTLCSKEKGTSGGKPIVVVAFTVQLPDGTLRRVQSVTTLLALGIAVDALRTVHAELEAAEAVQADQN